MKKTKKQKIQNPESTFRNKKRKPEEYMIRKDIEKNKRKNKGNKGLSK